MNQINFDISTNYEDIQNTFIIISHSLYVTMAECCQGKYRNFGIDIAINRWNKDIAASIQKLKPLSFTPTFVFGGDMNLLPKHEEKTKRVVLFILLAKLQADIYQGEEILDEYYKSILLERIYNPYWINPFDNVITNKNYFTQRF